MKDYTQVERDNAAATIEDAANNLQEAINMAIAALREKLQRQPDPDTGLVPCGCGSVTEQTDFHDGFFPHSKVECLECGNGLEHRHGLERWFGRIRRAKIMAILKNVEPNPKNGDLHLEPCPFCGQKDPVYIQYETDVGPRWKIFCLKCAAGVDPGWAQQRYPLASIWNRRYRDDPGTSGENNQGNLQDGD